MNVEEHQIERLGIQQLHGLPAIRRGRDVQIALTGKPSCQREAIVLDVVDDEQRGVGVAHDAFSAGASAGSCRAVAATPPAWYRSHRSRRQIAFSLSPVIAFAVRAITGMCLGGRTAFDPPGRLPAVDNG